MKKAALMLRERIVLLTGHGSLLPRIAPEFHVVAPDGDQLVGPRMMPRRFWTVRRAHPGRPRTLDRERVMAVPPGSPGRRNTP